MGKYHTATRYILGVQPEYRGLKIDPCFPSDWKEVTISRKFRKKDFTIIITNKEGRQKGVKSVTVNGKEIAGNLIPFEMMKEKNEVVVVM